MQSISAYRPSSVMAYAMTPSPRGRLTLRRVLRMKFVRIGACRRPYNAPPGDFPQKNIKKPALSIPRTVLQEPYSKMPADGA